MTNVSVVANTPKRSDASLFTSTNTGNRIQPPWHMQTPGLHVQHNSRILGPLTSGQPDEPTAE
jgi:hypothetical protein